MQDDEDDRGQTRGQIGKQSLKVVQPFSARRANSDDEWVLVCLTRRWPGRHESSVAQSTLARETKVLRTGNKALHNGTALKSRYIIAAMRKAPSSFC